MKNELLHIGPFTLYGYGLMIALGLTAAYLTAAYRSRRYCGDDENRMFDIVTVSMVGGLIAAKLLFWLTEIDVILKDPGFMLRTMGDGFVVFGGIAGGVLAGFLYCKAKKLKFLLYFDLLAPSLALGQGFGRIGCLLAGCCYGRETDCALSITFQNSAYAPNHVALIPTQIYSSLMDFLHFFVLLYVSKKKKADGQVAACYLIFYSIGRFIMEMFRGDVDRGYVGILSTSQFISIFALICGAALFLYVSKRQKA